MTDRFVFEKYSKSEEKLPQDISLSEIRSWRSGESQKIIETNHRSKKNSERNAHSSSLIEENKLNDLRASVSFGGSGKFVSDSEVVYPKKNRSAKKSSNKSYTSNSAKNKNRNQLDLSDVTSQRKIKEKKKKITARKKKSEIQLFLEQFSIVQRCEEFIEDNRIPFLFGISFVQIMIFALIFIFSFNQNARGSLFNMKFLTIDAKNQLVSNKEYNNSWKFNVGDLVIVKKVAESSLETGNYIAVYTDESKGDFLVREINAESSAESDNELVMQPENGEERLLTLTKESYIGKVTGQYKKLGTVIQKIMSFKILIIIFTTIVYCLLVYISLVWIK